MNNEKDKSVNGAPEKNTQKSYENDPFVKKATAVQMILPSAVLVIFCIIGLAFFARPERSESEKRELTKFPEFTWEAFWSGEYTDQISLWYSDTYPLREGMISANDAIKALYGVRGQQISTGNNVGDEIPDGPMVPAGDIDESTDGEQQTDNSDENNNESNNNNGSETGEQMGAFYVKGDTAYELYHFNQSNSERYASLINSAAQELDGKATVYDVIIPLSYTFALSDSERESIGASDGIKAVNYMYSGMSDKVRAVNICDNLAAHKDEYLYYRTDHHWTALGAYYAYESFCSVKGIDPTPLSSYEKLSFEGFLGTLYSDTKAQALKNHPDTVEAFVPIGTNSIVVTERNGQTSTYQIVNKNTDSWYQNAASKYNCFIAGDNPISEIHNPEKTDGSSVVVVKESFGNAFVPFLVDSYEYVYVLDYRYYDGSLYDLVDEKDIDDVIFVNNVIATATSARLNEMQDILK